MAVEMDHLLSHGSGLSKFSTKCSDVTNMDRNRNRKRLVWSIWEVQAEGRL